MKAGGHVEALTCVQGFTDLTLVAGLTGLREILLCTAVKAGLESLQS